MFGAIIEAIAGALAEFFAGRAAQKGLERAGKARGWITLGVLLALVVFLVWMGVYLIGEGVWYIAVILFAVAALIVYVTVAAAVRTRRRRGQ